MNNKLTARRVVNYYLSGAISNTDGVYLDRSELTYGTFEKMCRGRLGHQAMSLVNWLCRQETVCRDEEGRRMVFLSELKVVVSEQSFSLVLDELYSCFKEGCIIDMN